MQAVVHHGGAGTTAAGLRAGVPSLVVPFFGDQPFWGERLAGLQVGPHPLPRRQLTAERLARSLEKMCSGPNMQEKARQLGARIQQENGVQEAVARIEATANKLGCDLSIRVFNWMS